MDLKNLMLQPSLHAVLAIGFGMLLGWPMISIAGGQGHWKL